MSQLKHHIISVIWLKEPSADGFRTILQEGPSIEGLNFLSLSFTH